MITILVFLLILGFLVFVHELGHFVVARRNGIKAEEFGFGFPPRIAGLIKNENSNKWEFIRGNKEIRSKNTIYSFNWLPLGGFVKIKGEDGHGKKEEDSFASKSAWTRIKVLLAGVFMNAIFAWIFFSLGFMLGTYQEVADPNTPGSQIVITTVENGSPAAAMGIRPNDFISKDQTDSRGQAIVLRTVKEFQDYVAANKGESITIDIFRAGQALKLTGTPRAEIQAGQGLLGVGLAQVSKVRFSFREALWQGLQEVGNVSLMMVEVLKALFSGAGGVEVSGIVGVAAVTGQVIPLGLAAIFRLVAIFSLNLAFINALPFPALDGGRILFILIEKIKGSPVSQKVEQAFHTAGFVLLMFLMVVVTYQDLLRLDVVAKIKGWL